MDTRINADRAIIERYIGQPTALPGEIRRQLVHQWGNAEIEAYAMADLDASMSLGQTWLVVGARHVAIAKVGNGHVKQFERAAIARVREIPGLSCNTMILAGNHDEPLAVLRYSHRQRRTMDAVRLVLNADAELGHRLSTDWDGRYATGVAGPIREAQALVAANEMAVIWRLLGYLKPYRKRVVTGLAAAATITGLSLAPPFLAGYLVDAVIRPVQDGTMSLSEGAAIAWTAVAAIAVVYLIRQLAAWMRLRVMSVLGEYVARDLRTAVYEHMQSLSLSFFSRKKTGNLISRVSHDTDRLWEFLALGVVDVSLSIVMLLGLGAVLISLDWRLGLVMTVPVPFLCGFIYLHGRQMNALFARAWRRWSQVTDVLSDTIPGMRVVKAFNQEEREKQRFGERNSAATRDFNQIHRQWTTFWPTLMLIVHAMTVTVWIFAIPRLLGTETGAVSLSAGTFVSFLLYMTMFAAPIDVIGQMARIINRATTSAHRIFEILDTEPEVVDRAAPRRLEPIQGQVTFDRVSFAYDGVRRVLHDVSFDVQPGEMIGLVGPSGGGKSTIASLIARFYDPMSGVIRVDGVDLRDLDTGHYRRQLGMVLQDPYLFHGTVADNIRYGSPDATISELVEAARTANAHDFICRLPHAYETVVGERGHTLSGGERQRISIARAILCNPRILILDEATSSVDTETEWKIQEALNRLITGRTVLAIAHRLSTLRRASRLFVIEHGRVAEVGTHSQLYANPDSTYRRLCDMQRNIQAVI